MTSTIFPKPAAGTEASFVYERAIKGEVAAITELARANELGIMGIASNRRAAFDLYQQAVRAGDARAMVHLGGMYGAGVHSFPPQDFVMARCLFEMAVEKGDVGAYLCLADYCYRGVGGPTDIVRSRQLFCLAAENGSTSGMQRLAHLLDKGLGGPPDYNGAAEWYLRAALQGDSGAQRQLLSNWTSGWSEKTRIAIQTQLLSQGVYDGPLDGNFEDKTLAALRELIGPISDQDYKDALKALSEMERTRKQRLT